ncbi:MAG: hypothetical protein IT337_11845, partial [Thermomicrobiales bacterium]|nr:hypothetical protein [Thermomicrobiales bacterium]
MRRQVTILALLGLIVSLLAPVARAQTPASSTSPTYGYSVTWDPAVWTIDDGETLVADGPHALDRIVLTNGSNQLFIEGARRYGGDAGACVQGEFDDMARAANVSDIEPIPDLAAGGVDRAIDARALTLALSAGGSVRLAFYVDCRRLDQDSVVLATLVATRSDLESGLALARPVIDAIVLPGDRTEASADFTERLFTAQLAEPLAGPLEGALTLDADALVTLPSDVETADFAASATFENPYAATDRAWDIGFAFRRTATNAGYRLIVDSDGAWRLVEGSGPAVASGHVSGLATGVRETNTIDLVAQGGRGGFAVNGVFIADLDLSARLAAGDVRAGSGFFTEDVVAGAVTPVTGFTVWPLTAQPASFDAATFAAAIATAREATPVAGPLAGTLDPVGDQAALIGAGTALADFAARVRWAVPDGDASWDAGFAFRDQPDGRHYRLMFDSSGGWTFGIGTEPSLAAGQAPLALADGAVNTVELVV